MVEHLAAIEPDISLRWWWRPNTELKESEYWTYIDQVDTNMIPNECSCCSVSAECTNKQLFALSTYYFVIYFCARTKCVKLMHVWLKVNLVALNCKDLCESQKSAAERAERELDPSENTCSALPLCEWQVECFTYKQLKVNQHVLLLDALTLSCRLSHTSCSILAGPVTFPVDVVPLILLSHSSHAEDTVCSCLKCWTVM